MYVESHFYYLVLLSSLPSRIIISRVRKSFSEQRVLAAVAVNIPLFL